MKIKARTYLIFAFFLTSSFVFSQQTRVELGDKYYDQFAYKKAIRLYKGALERGEGNNWRLNARLGDCYYNISQPKEALKYYKEAKRLNGKLNESYLLRYALSLQGAGEPQNEVLEAYKEYYKKIGVEDVDSLSLRAISEVSLEEPENLSINTEYSDFGALIYDDIFYFSSSRENPDKKNKHNKRLYKWNEQPFLDIYSAEIDRGGNDISLRLVPNDSSSLSVINTMAHESSIAITKDSMTMYFSGSAVTKKGKPDYNKDGTANFRLQRASNINGKWVVTKKDKDDMSFLNFEDYSVGNAVLNPNNDKLFFVSCAPFIDAKGQTDIYYVDIDEDGNYGKVTNVPGINTNGRESFPFITSDGTLYYSSDGVYDGKLSYGLLDIYKVENIDEVIAGKKAKIVHLESPINSTKDDFAFYLDESVELNACEYEAYFSSNRDHDDAKGDDDIYRFRIKKERVLNGVITDSKTQEPLVDAQVELFDANGKTIDAMKVDDNGAYSFTIECDKTYNLRASSNEKYTDAEVYGINKADADEIVNLELEPIPCEIPVDHIEFDKNSAEINFEAKVALLPVLELLWTNPNLKIRIESHTDSSGSADYNRELSNRRAEATRLYLIGADVNENQIVSAKGFGEDCLLYSDADIEGMREVERKEANKHNRRSRFIIEDCNDVVENCKEN